MSNAFFVGNAGNSAWLLLKALSDNGIELRAEHKYPSIQAAQDIKEKLKGEFELNFGFIDTDDLTGIAEEIGFLTDLSNLGIAMFGLTRKSFGIKQSVEGLSIVAYENLSLTLRDRL